MLSTALQSFRHRPRWLTTGLVACALLAAAGAHAQVIYNSVDSTGRVIYSQ